MKLSRLYSNKPDIFVPIEFVHGLNVVLAEIRVPQNKKRDTHNLGKTTLGRLLDYCFLTTRNPKFFLFKHIELFEQFVFYLEIELMDGSFVTIRRGVEDSSKISFKKHQSSMQDFTLLHEENWDHANVAFESAKSILDGLLDLRALAPWSFRNALGYLLRSQDDYTEVFQLGKFVSAHSDWKPYLAHILGFDSALIESHYEKENELTEKQATAQTINAELGGTVEDISKIEGVLLLKQRELSKRQALLDAFDFRAHDKGKTKDVVENIDSRIATLNSERYSLSQNLKKVIDSLQEDQILFNPDEAEELFKEVGVIFQGQIKRDFQQLLDFNTAITEERRAYLQEERVETENAVKEINVELTSLGKKRSEALAFLSGTDIFNKYKQTTDELVTLRADIASLERQREFTRRLQELRTQIRTIAEEKTSLQSKIEQDVEKQNSDPNSLFASIRVFFSEIVEEVIDKKALLSVAPNSYGHLEYKAEILDSTGIATSADLGHTYRKLLCVAFDLAVLRAHLGKRFPQFVFHDGVLESLDDRKKENLINVIREYADLGIQHIITLIDSDLPARPKAELPVFEESEIVLRLHDENQEGRLFRMKSW